MKTDARKERLSLITPFKEAQEALKQEEIRVQGLRDRLSELAVEEAMKQEYSF